MKKFLFLDDTKDRHDHFDSVCAGLGVEVWHVWNAIQAIRMLEGRKFDCVFLDHDLEDTGRDTGFVVAEFIALHCLFDSRPTQVVIHSWNCDGAKAMETILRDNGFTNVSRVPFSFNNTPKKGVDSSHQP
jgi:CheY-like chemotaxis protein